MPGEQHGLVADQPGASGLADAGRQRVHRGGDIVERSRPAAAALARPAVLRYADREPRGRQRGRERAGVHPVEGRPPEPAMQEHDQRRRAGGPARQAHIRHAVGPGTVADHQVRRRRGPGQHIRCQRASTSHGRPPIMAGQSHPQHPGTGPTRHPVTASRGHSARFQPSGHRSSQFFPPGGGPGYRRVAAHLPRSHHVSAMKVYFLLQQGKLEPLARGGTEVSSYSDWECLAR